MYNVLLADDERPELEGLRSLVPWHEFEMRIDGAVHNGFDALKHLEHYPIDILVTDVKMPGMSGIELAQSALQRQPELKVVFISGYEDFQYAKEALRLGACDYVLKPVNGMELAKVLEEVRQKLASQLERHRLEETYSRSIPYLRNELVLGLLQGSYSAETWEEQWRSLRIPLPRGPYWAAVIEVDDIAWKLNHYPHEERAEMVEKMRNYLTEECMKRKLGHTCRIMGESRIGLLMSGNTGIASLGVLIEDVKSGFPLSVTAGVGREAKSEAEVSVSFSEAQQALSAKMALGKGRVISLDDVSLRTAAHVGDMDAVIAKLYRASSDYRLVEIDDCLIELFELAAKLDTRLSVYHFSIHILTKLDMHLHGINEDVYRLLEIEYENLDILYRFETIEDIKTWFRRQLFEISEKLYSKKQSKNRKLITELQQYIDSRLDGEVTLKEVAECFHFSPNHLGQIFKETGETFSDYVIRRRLELAKAYLSDPKLKIYEVAQKAGYSNFAYFSKQFKLVFGISPGEYRKQC